MKTKDVPCSGGCGRYRSVTCSDSPEQWLCYECAHPELSTDALHGFFTLTHALSYLAVTRNRVADDGRADYLRCSDVITPLLKQIAKPFRDAGIFKPEAQ